MLNRLLKHCIISSVEMSCVGTFIYLYTALFIFSWELDIENEGLVLWEKFMYFGLRTIHLTWMTPVLNELAVVSANNKVNIKGENKSCESLTLTSMLLKWVTFNE